MSNLHRSLQRNNQQAPVVYLAFANDREEGASYLRNLADEARRLEAALRPAEEAGLIEIVLRQNVTADQMLGLFQEARYRDRVAIFHYGGHANGYNLLLETAQGRVALAGADGLAAFLGHQTGLQLVFLNGCSTEAQAEGLLDAGVATVIATSQAIDDQVASDFAAHFYQGLAGGAGIETAFSEAESRAKTSGGNNTRDLYRPDAVETSQGQALADRWPWALHFREGGELAGRWNLPDAVDDPLFGLPSLALTDLPDSPFRNILWFRPQDAPIFFGRGYDIRNLYQRITAPDGAPIVLYYGQSGVGKSSLLAAGLLPRLEQVQRVAYTRREQTEGLVGSLAAALKAPGAFEDPRQLGDAWLAAEADAGQPFTLILDQVEEAYTRPNDAIPNEAAQFLDALDVIFGDRRRRPQGRLVLGFRKEWLAEIEKTVAERGLPMAKIFLERLDRRGIIEAVNGPARSERLQRHFGLAVEDGLADEIADDLLADPSSAVAPTLQILLDKMWHAARALDYDHPSFDRTLYRDLRRQGVLLGDFLDQQLVSLAKDQPAAVASGLALDLLTYHTTRLGTAEQRTLNDLRSTYPHQSDSLTELLSSCRDLYLLVDPRENQPDAEPASRLAHDTLAPLVRARFDESATLGQRARRILESRVASGEEGTDPTPMGDANLAVVEAGKSGMRAWTDDERHLIDISRAASRRRRKIRNLAMGALATLALLIVVAGGIAFWQWGEAAKQAEIADAEAVKARTEAVRADNEADRARAEADRADNEAAAAIAAGEVAEREKNRALTNASRALSAISELRLVSDPVAALNLSLDALPSAADPRPYVPEAEYALMAAVQESMETGYYATGAQALTANDLAMNDENRVRAWTALGGEDVRLISPDLSTVITMPLGVDRVAWLDETTLLATDDNVVHLWRNPEATSEVASRQADETIYCMVPRPDSTQFALCVGDRIQVWGVNAGALVTTTQEIRVAKQSGRTVRWSQDGTWLATGEVIDGRRLPLLWKPDTGDEPQPSSPFTLTQAITAGGFRFVDDDRLATWNGSRMVWLWTLGETGAAPNQEADAESLLTRFSVQDLAVSPSGNELFVFHRNGPGSLWTLGDKTPEEIDLLEGHQKPIRSVAWRPIGSYLATAAEDGTARVWRRDASGITEVNKFIGHRNGDTGDDVVVIYAIRWQPNGRELMTVGEDSTVRTWRAFRPEPQRLDEHNHQPLALAWRDDKTLLVARKDGLVDAFDIGDAGSDGIGAVESITHATGVTTVAQFHFHPSNSSALVVDGDDAGLLSSFERDRSTPLLWDEEEPFSALALSPAQLLAVGRKDGSVELWDQRTGERLASLAVAPSESNTRIRHIAWAHNDEAIFAATSADIVRCPVAIDDIDDGEPCTVFLSRAAGMPLDQSIKGLALSPSEDYLAIGSGDRQLVVVDAADGHLVGKRIAEDTVRGVHWVTRKPWPYQNTAGTHAAQLQGAGQEDAQQLLLFAVKDKIILWDPAANRDVFQIAGRPGPVISHVAASPAGNRIATISGPVPHVVEVWESWLQDPEGLLDFAAGKKTRELDGAQ